MSSDDFFLESGHPSFDLVFVDGWHEFHQVLRDLRNSLGRLTPSGLVVLDDVLPGSNVASQVLPQLSSENDLVPAGWTGDVYRVVYFLSLVDPEGLHYATITDGGPIQTIVSATAANLDWGARIQDAENLTWDPSWSQDIPAWFRACKELDPLVRKLTLPRR